MKQAPHQQNHFWQTAGAPDAAVLLLVLAAADLGYGHCLAALPPCGRFCPQQ